MNTSDSNIIPRATLPTYNSRFQPGDTVRICESYLNDEVTQDMDTSKTTTIQSIPRDDEELVMIQYEGGLIDYVPQNILFTNLKQL